MNNQEFVESLLEKSRFIFEKDKHLVPVLIINKAKTEEDRDQFVVADTVDFMDNGKDALAQIISQLRTQIRQIAFITEAWVAMAKPEELQSKEFVPPSQRADKKEVALINFYFGNEMELYMADLTGDGKDKQMAKWEKMEGPTAGRFINGKSDISEFCTVPEEELKDATDRLV